MPPADSAPKRLSIPDRQAVGNEVRANTPATPPSASSVAPPKPPAAAAPAPPRRIVINPIHQIDTAAPAPKKTAAAPPARKPATKVAATAAVTSSASSPPVPIEVPAAPKDPPLPPVEPAESVEPAAPEVAPLESKLTLTSDPPSAASASPEPADDSVDLDDDAETTDVGGKKPSAETKQALEAAAAEAKREQELQGYIDDRQFFVPINAVARKRSIIVSVSLTVLILLLALALVDLMLDSGIILLLQKIPHTHFFSLGS